MMLVRDLIAILQSQPQDAVAVIDDSDTGWQLNIDSVMREGDVVAIGGSYSDIHEKK